MSQQPSQLPTECVPEHLAGRTVDTPGCSDIADDITEPPALPDVHPLNVYRTFELEGYKLSLFKRSPLGHDIVELDIPERLCLTIHPYVHMEARNTAQGPVVGVLGVVKSLPIQLAIRYNINWTNKQYSDYENYRAVMKENRLFIQMVPAVPSIGNAIHYRMQYNRNQSGWENIGDVFVYAHPDNGNEVIGLYFAPPPGVGHALQRSKWAAGWAAYNWGEPGVSMRVKAPDQSAVRSTPGPYIENLVTALLNRRISFLQDDWGLKSVPGLPPWITEQMSPSIRLQGF